MRRYWLCLLSLSANICLAENIHPDVSSAIEYTTPTDTCPLPKNYSFTMPVDVELLKKDEKRYFECDVKFAETLVGDFEKLKSSARHGLTQSQAELILSNMASIQTELENRKQRRERYLQLNARKFNHINLNPE